MRLASPRSLLLSLAAACALACGGSSVATEPGPDGGGAGPDAGPGVGPLCGNGVLDPGEQCDDGNTVSYDGCSSTCQLEESQRVDWLQMQFASDGVCANDALGEAIVYSAAQTELQDQINSGVDDGAISVLLTFLGADPTGASESGLTLGVLGGSPEEPAGSPSYSGSADLDWWYSPDPSSIAASGAPLAQLSASIAGGVLTAGPGSLTLSLSFGNGVAAMTLSDANLIAPVGPLTAPLETTNSAPPGHLPAEHVSPTLTTITSLGAQSASGAATLCGHVSAKSLSTALLPSEVVGACSAYTTTSSFLDLLVGGCKAYGVVQVVNATQPDQVDASQPAAGAGAPYALSASSGTAVDTCKDKTGASVELGACLAAAAYSSYFKLATDRVIIRH